jgi:hypothetical protein
LRQPRRLRSTSKKGTESHGSALRQRRDPPK